MIFIPSAQQNDKPEPPAQRWLFTIYIDIKYLHAKIPSWQIKIPGLLQQVRNRAIWQSSLQKLPQPAAKHAKCKRMRTHTPGISMQNVPPRYLGVDLRSETLEKVEEIRDML